MVNFDRFLCEAQTRVNLRPIRLIRAWENEEVDSISREISNAICTSRLIGSKIDGLRGTNQSKGNQVEKYLVSKINCHCGESNRIIDAPGNGYPDRIFRVNSKRYFMEIKATSKWSGQNSQRRVLTATPEKMRKLINQNLVDNPPAHLICTVIYSETSSCIDKIRLDFIHPKTEIDVRFEASTSQKRLEIGDHKKIEFG